MRDRRPTCARVRLGRRRRSVPFPVGPRGCRRRAGRPLRPRRGAGPLPTVLLGEDGRPCSAEEAEEEARRRGWSALEAAVVMECRLIEAGGGGRCSARWLELDAIAARLRRYLGDSDPGAYPIDFFLSRPEGFLLFEGDLEELRSGPARGAGGGGKRSRDGRRRGARRERRGGEGMEAEDDGDGPLGEHHGARGFDHPPSDCESDDGFCEDDGFY